MNGQPARILVVDDSAYMRKVMREMLDASPRLQVVGTARNGVDALERAVELQPDVVVVDLNMPDMDGVGYIQEQMQRRPLPIVLVSAVDGHDPLVLDGLQRGAVDFVQKPTALALDQMYQMSTDLVERVANAAGMHPLRLSPPVEGNRGRAPASQSRFDALVVGISTGGPQALRYLLPQLPADFPLAVAIVLHMPVGYTGPFAEKLDEVSRVEVLEARDGLEMLPGRAILAQAGYHLALQRAPDGVRAHLDISPENLLYRPSVDVLFRSAAQVYNERVLSAVLTGMGRDGTEGAAWIKAQGGRVITEAESSCVVYGMPRSVVEAGLSDRAASLDMLIPSILEELS